MVGDITWLTKGCYLPDEVMLCERITDSVCY